MDCFKYIVKDIDMVICCNILYYDVLCKYFFEFFLVIKLYKEFGFDDVVVFDIFNVCVGVFIGIYLVDVYLKFGFVERVMVVSGEYIIYLMKIV